MKCPTCDSAHCDKCGTSIPGTTPPQIATCADCNTPIVWVDERARWRHWLGARETRCPRQTCPEPAGEAA